MTHRPDGPIDPEVAGEEHLANTEVEQRLDQDPEAQPNRAHAPDIDERRQGDDGEPATDR